jgi:hypothetical protein
MVREVERGEPQEIEIIDILRLQLLAIIQLLKLVIICHDERFFLNEIGTQAHHGEGELDLGRSNGVGKDEDLAGVVIIW